MLAFYIQYKSFKTPHVSSAFPSPQQGRTQPEVLMTLEPVHLGTLNLALAYIHNQDSGCKIILHGQKQN